MQYLTTGQLFEVKSDRSKIDTFRSEELGETKNEQTNYYEKSRFNDLSRTEDRISQRSNESRTSSSDDTNEDNNDANAFQKLNSFGNTLNLLEVNKNNDNSESKNPFGSSKNISVPLLNLGSLKNQKQCQPKGNDLESYKFINQLSKRHFFICLENHQNLLTNYFNLNLIFQNFRERNKEIIKKHDVSRRVIIYCCISKSKYVRERQISNSQPKFAE